MEWHTFLFRSWYSGQFPIGTHCHCAHGWRDDLLHRWNFVLLFTGEWSSSIFETMFFGFCKKPELPFLEFFQTYLSHKMSNTVSRSTVVWLRAILSALSIFLTILTITTGYMSMLEFKGERREFWKKNQFLITHHLTYHSGENYMTWERKDGGWSLHISSAIAEWILAVVYCIFLLTFAPEFRLIHFEAPEVKVSRKWGKSLDFLYFFLHTWAERPILLPILGEQTAVLPTGWSFLLVFAAVPTDRKSRNLKYNRRSAHKIGLHSFSFFFHSTDVSWNGEKPKWWIIVFKLQLIYLDREEWDLTKVSETQTPVTVVIDVWGKRSYIAFSRIFYNEPFLWTWRWT